MLGKRYARHDLPVRQILPVTFVCYAFNLNLSAWVGGIALRFRLYSRLGLKPAQITRVFTMSILTNWLGYMWLAGLIFAMGWIEPPASWEIGFTALRVVGGGLLVACVVYLGLCGFSRRRSWTIRGHEIQLPSLRLALIQLVLGAANWSLMALVVYYMLSQQADYPEVLGILMISSIAGVVAHIPAGLGVIEAVFVAMLADEMSKGAIVGGLIGYRVIYFLIRCCSPRWSTWCSKRGRRSCAAATRPVTRSRFPRKRAEGPQHLWDAVLIAHLAVQSAATR